MGNLTRDPEMRTSQGGTTVVKFGMAINRKFKDQETTCYVDCTAFGRTGEVINQYMKRGRPIFVEGRLDFSSWQDKDGNKRSKLGVVVENFQFMGQGQGGQNQGGGGYSQQGGQGQQSNQDYGGGFGDQGGFGEEAEGEIPF
jgi:single-strand DNA-binding protein